MTGMDGRKTIKLMEGGNTTYTTHNTGWHMNKYDYPAWRNKSANS